MSGFPPEGKDQVTLANWREAPFNSWSFHHVREIVPSAEIANDPDAVNPLPSGPQADLAGLSFTDGDGRSWDSDRFLEASATDALVILKSGTLVHETYRNGMGPGSPHILMSVSKSMLGLLAGILVDGGLLDPDSPAVAAVPELGHTAYRGATIRHLLDMRAGIAFDEQYDTLPAHMAAYRKATGWNPADQGDPPVDLRSYFGTLTGTDGPHGRGFHYVSPNTDLLAWIFERLTGTRYADLFTDLMLRPLGAERPACITVDRLGAPRAAGGVCMTARDLARVGQMLVDGGTANGRRVLSSAWIEDIAGAADTDAWNAGSFAPLFPGITMHYRSKWYVRHGEGSHGPLLFGIGVHGQNLFVDCGRALVIAKFSSQARPLDPGLIDLTSRWVQAVRNSM